MNCANPYVKPNQKSLIAGYPLNNVTLIAKYNRTEKNKTSLNDFRNMKKEQTVGNNLEIRRESLRNIQCKAQER